MFDLTSKCSLDMQRTAFVGEVSLTFEQVQSKAGAIGHALEGAGLRAGDLVAIATSHRASFYTSFAACFACGFPVVIINSSAGFICLLFYLSFLCMNIHKFLLCFLY